MAVRPSWKQGYARSADESERSGLRRALAAAWEPSFGPTGSTVHDVSGHGVQGTFQNMSPGDAWVVGENSRVPGEALELGGGANELVNIPIGALPFASGESFTLFAWVYLATAQQQHAVSIGAGLQDAGPHLGCLSSTTWRFGIWGGSEVDSTTLYATDVWRFLVGTYENGTGRLYVNGQLVGTSGAFTFTGTNGSARIGALNNEANSWDGKLGPTRVWRRAISLVEIADIYEDSMAMWRRRRRVGVSVPAVVAGRIMSSLTRHGGLAGYGGIAGPGGGLAA